LSDVATERDDWRISQLDFEEGSRLAIHGTQLVLGTDEILVPNEFASRVLPGANLGAVSRIYRFFRNVMGRRQLEAVTQTDQHPSKGEKSGTAPKEPGIVDAGGP
jgi:hypothetical protein